MLIPSSSPLSCFLFEPSIAFPPSVFSLSYPNLSVIPCFFSFHFQSLCLSLSLSKFLFFTHLHYCFSSLRWQNCLMPAVPNEKSGFLAGVCKFCLLPFPSKDPLGQFWCVLGEFPRECCLVNTRCSCFG